MASWTYNVRRIHSLRKTENGSVVIRLGARKMPLVHVDRFNLLCHKVVPCADEETTILFAFHRKSPDANWVIEAFTDGQHLRKDVRTRYGLEDLSFSQVMSFAKRFNPTMHIEIL